MKDCVYVACGNASFNEYVEVILGKVGELNFEEGHWELHRLAMGLVVKWLTCRWELQPRERRKRHQL
ncbi:hypothetical protein [Sulfodiicoccus acidiphilus]|nr:hypothetical protein [Sulfodiicoccus acidiphilus]